MVARHKISGAGTLKGLDFAKFGRYIPLLKISTSPVLMEFCSRLVTNSSDRTLRQFNLPTYPSPSTDGSFVEQELEPTYRFNDPISKVAWHAMSYSPDGEWLAGGEIISRCSLGSISRVAGAADNATHKVYIWDIANEGQFASTLEGGREPLIHVHVSLDRMSCL